MAKINLIDSFENKKYTIQYKGPKIRLFTKRIAIPKVNSTTNGRYLPTKRHFQALLFLREVLN